MLTYAAFLPHTPLLLPNIGREGTTKLADTLAAFEKVSAGLRATRPETIVLFSSHPGQNDVVFSINLSDRYYADLREYGDFTETFRWKPDLLFIDRLQRQARKSKLPIKLDSHPGLTHGAAVPLQLLTDDTWALNIVPVSYIGSDPKKHVEFGRLLKEVCMETGRRVAVIGTGDLSHALSSDAPAGFHPEGKEFDERVQEAIRGLSLSTLLGMDPSLVENAHECAYRPLLMLFGVIEQMNLRPTIHSYEAPFGVGYLVADFTF
ncbi:hypothetical protein HYV73_02580 [Candidatus Uhrbacteria bacterium]|nr:hypothetical protein [Candidatus Uhrbacteria bacterium]